MRKSKKTLKIDECLMLKKEKKTHQSPGSHQVPRLKLMKKEKIGQDFFFFFFFFFWDCKDKGLEFWGLVGSGTSASESVSKKTKQKNKK